jgi:hypothetical protein
VLLKALLTHSLSQAISFLSRSNHDRYAQLEKANCRQPGDLVGLLCRADEMAPSIGVGVVASGFVQLMRGCSPRRLHACQRSCMRAQVLTHGTRMHKPLPHAVSQVSTRLISFVLNLLIARHLSPEAYALSTVQFHLITTTILLLSREGLRRGCLRLRPESAKAS